MPSHQSSPSRPELLTAADVRTWHALPPAQQIALRDVVRDYLHLQRELLQMRAQIAAAAHSPVRWNAVRWPT